GVVVSDLRLRDREIVERAGEQRPVVVQGAQDRDLPLLHLDRLLPLVLLGVEAAERPQALGRLAAVGAEDLLADPESLRPEPLGLGTPPLVRARPRALVDPRGALRAPAAVEPPRDRARPPQQLLRFARLPLDLQALTERDERPRHGVRSPALRGDTGREGGT